MCNCKSVVRWAAVLVLLVAVSGCLVGFIAPFWARYEPGLPRKPVPAHGSDSQNNVTVASVKGAVGIEAVPVDDVIPPLRLPAESEGLWARCNSVNFTHCILFWQNNFQLEHSFPPWHKAAQILYLVGVVILVAVLVVACFNVCNCHCCRCCLLSSSLPTALGALTVIGVLPILASIAVYGALAYKERGISLMVASSNTSAAVPAAIAGASVTGSTVNDEQVVGLHLTSAVFDWAYYVAAASVALSLVAATLLYCDGRHSVEIVVGEDGKGRYQQTTNVEVDSPDQ